MRIPYALNEVLPAHVAFVKNTTFVDLMTTGIIFEGPHLELT